MFRNPKKKNNTFLDFYSQFKNKIFNYFWYRVNFDRDLAEDLTSEVFLKAYDKFDLYDPDRPFQSWIFTIAHNHLVNFYKSNSANRSVPLDEALNLTNDNKSGPEERLDFQILTQEIIKLPDYQRELLTLRYINEFSNGEIAEILEKDEGAIRVAIHRALNDLRESLQKKES